MITQGHIQHILLSSGFDSARDRQEIDLAVTKLHHLIEKQDEQYRELVEAATWLKTELDGEVKGRAAKAVIEAVQPFLPPKPSLSENLEALRPRICQDDSIVDNKLKEYIAEAKQLEAKVNE